VGELGQLKNLTRKPNAWRHNKTTCIHILGQRSNNPPRDGNIKTWRMQDCCMINAPQRMLDNEEELVKF
jgi:hypothetical protein